MSYDITSPTDPSFSSSLLTVHEELHCWVIESMLFIKSIFLAALALLSLFVFTSLPLHLRLLPFFFFIIDSPGTCSLQLFITSPFFPFYLVSLSDSPESPADCFSVREQIITLQRFSSAFLSSRLLSVLMWRERFDFVVGHCSPQSPGFLHVMENRAAKTGVPRENYAINCVFWVEFLCLGLMPSRRLVPSQQKVRRWFQKAEHAVKVLCRQAAVLRFITTHSFWGKLDGY